MALTSDVIPIFLPLHLRVKFLHIANVCISHRCQKGLPRESLLSTLGHEKFYEICVYLNKDSDFLLTDPICCTEGVLFFIEQYAALSLNMGFISQQI